LNNIKFGNSKIQFDIVRSSKRKTTEILVDRSGVRVLAPSYKSERQIGALIKANARWIYRKQLGSKEETQEKLSFHEGSKLPYLGRYHILQFIEYGERISLSRGKFTVRGIGLTQARIRLLYTEWLRTRGQSLIEREVGKFAGTIGVSPRHVVVKNISRKWGSTTKKGNLNFNLNLLRAPKQIIRYVVAHELCHLKVPNHSRQFWRLLSKIDPSYETNKEWLRTNNSILVD